MTIATMDTEGKWMVGDAHIYIPSTPCKVEHSNITGSSTGRDESGVMHIDWLRRDVRKVFLTYNLITASELAYMMNLMQLLLKWQNAHSVASADGSLQLLFLC